MNKTALILIVVLFSLFGPAARADDEGFQSTLDLQYHDKILSFRHPLEKGSQVYDADGTPLKGGHEGAWTLFGRVLVKKIRVEKDSLLIE